jgi:hypothetical protein
MIQNLKKFGTTFLSPLRRLVSPSSFDDYTPAENAPLKSINRLSSILLPVLSLLFLIELLCVLAGFFIHPKKNWISLLLCIFLIALFDRFIFSLKNYLKEFKIEKKYLLQVIAIATFLFAVGRYYPTSMTQNVSIVESNQSVVFDIESINSWAATEQQAPMDYYLVYTTQFLLGKNVLGLRIKNMVETFAFLMILFALFHFITKDWLIAFLLQMFFLGNPNINFHLWHARPLALALTHYGLLLATLFTLKEKKWPTSIVVSVFYLLLLSCGYQPMIALFSSCTVMVWVDRDREANSKIIRSFLIASALFLPTLFEIITMSYEAQQFHNDSRIFLRSVGEIFSFKTWQQFYSSSAYNRSLAWSILVILFLLSWKVIRKSKQVKFAIANYFFFFVVFVVIFKTFIDYEILTHYFILGVLNFGILLAAIVSLNIDRGHWRKLAARFSVFFLLVAMLSYKGFLPNGGRTTLARPPTYNATALFNYMSEITEPDDYAYIISLQVPGLPVRTRFIGQEFFTPKSGSPRPNFRPPLSRPFYLKFPETWNSDNYLYQDLKNGEKPKRLILVHLKKDVPEDIENFVPFVPPQGVQMVQKEDFDLFIVPTDKGFAKSALEFYLAFIQTGKGNPNLVSMVETAIFLSLETKDQKAFNELYKLYNSFREMGFRSLPQYIRYHDSRGFLYRVFSERAQALGWKINP